MRLTEIRTDPRPVAVARVGVGLATIFNAVEAFEEHPQRGVGRATRGTRVRGHACAVDTVAGCRSRRRGRGWGRRDVRLDDGAGGRRLGRAERDGAALGSAGVQQPPAGSATLLMAYLVFAQSRD